MGKKRSAFTELIIGPFQKWSKDNASTLAAALAYYTVMSMLPLLLIIIIIASFFLKTSIAVDQLTAQIARFSSPDIANFLKTLLAHPKNPLNGSIASIITIITLIMGASGIFSQLQSSLNRIWNVQPKNRRGIKGTIKNQATSFVAVILIGILFLIFLALDSFISFLISTIPVGSQNHLVATIGNYIVLFLALTVLIGLIFRIVPDKQISWKDVWLGAAVTSLLFLVGRFLIGLYLGFNKTASGYGTAGSLVVLLIWIYYSAQIFFFGAEFTQVYAQTFGTHKNLPEEGAPVEKQDENQSDGKGQKEEITIEKTNP